MSITNWKAVLASYTGVLQFPAVTDSFTGNSLPSVSIPLYIDQHPIAVRPPKVTEVSTISLKDSNSDMEAGTAVLFYGAPDPLQLAISGWLITPILGSYPPRWNPTVDGTIGGTSLSMLDWNYADLIYAYIEGRLSRRASGRWVRTDPISYTDPYGRQYSNQPVISSFDAAIVRPNKKQTFSMTMYFET